MREVLSTIPEEKAPHDRCCRCGDKIVPRLKIYILYSYDPKAGKLLATFAHPACARQAGLIKEDHEIPGDVVELFWKRWAKKVAGR